MNASRLKELLLDSLEQPAERRATFVARACGTDPALRDRLETMLAAHQRAAGFLAEPVRPTRPAVSAGSGDPLCGECIGAYEILAPIGSGGFGAVYLAQQLEPLSRRVALKLIKPGMDSEQVIRRFETERMALARMEHPGIAQVFDAGKTPAGRPYFVMEYVAGAPITAFCDEHKLTLRERLELFEQVCRAVQHAHQKGVIHRDLKPSNVLVTRIDERPVPKVIDFGIAKAVQPDEREVALTREAQVIGTPQYMSPEQAGMPGVEVDTRTDVYGLGVLLFELLAGVLPFAVEHTPNIGVPDFFQLIRVADPPAPSTRLAGLGDRGDPIAAARRLDTHRLWRALKGELDWIVLRAVERDPARRYPTADALAADIRRYLRAEPIDAGPPSWGYRLSTFVRRRRRELAAVAALGLALLLLAAGSVWFGLRERAAARRLEAELKRSDALAGFAQRILSGVDPVEARGADTRLLKRILGGAAERVDGDLAEYPGAAVTMLNTIGFAYLKIGDFAGAERVLRTAYERGQVELGPDNDATIDAGGNLAVALVELSRIAEAEPLVRRVWEARRAAHGGDAPTTLEALSNLASLYERSGRHAEARPLLEALLAARERTLGHDHPSTLTARNNLAMTLDELGEQGTALVLIEQVRASQLRSIGSDHPQTLMTSNNLAAICRALGQLDRAEQLYRETLTVKERVLEEGHPSLIVSRGNLAGLLAETGRVAESEALYRQTSQSALAHLGPRDPRTIAAQTGLANSLRALRRTAEAEPLLQQAYALSVEVSGPDHPSTIAILGTLAGALSDLGRGEQAEERVRAALVSVEQSLGAAAPLTVRMMCHLAGVLASQQKYAEAEELLREADRRARAAGAAQTPICVVEAFVALYQKSGRTDEAQRWIAASQPVR